MAVKFQGGQAIDVDKKRLGSELRNALAAVRRAQDALEIVFRDVPTGALNPYSASAAALLRAEGAVEEAINKARL